MTVIRNIVRNILTEAGYAISNPFFKTIIPPDINGKGAELRFMRRTIYDWLVENGYTGAYYRLNAHSTTHQIQLYIDLYHNTDKVGIESSDVYNKDFDKEKALAFMEKILKTFKNYWATDYVSGNSAKFNITITLKKDIHLSFSDD